MLEGEARLNLGEDVCVMEPDDIRRLKVCHRVSLLLVLDIRHLHVELGRADRSHKGSIGGRDANSISCREIDIIHKMGVITKNIPELT